MAESTIYKPPTGAQIIDRNTGALIEYATGDKYYDLSATSGLGGNQYGPQIGDPVDTGGMTLEQLNSGQAPTATVDVFGNPVGNNPTAITSAELGAGGGSARTDAPINVPTSTQIGGSKADTLIAGVEQGIKDQISNLDDTPEQQQADALTQEIGNLLPELGGKGGAQLQAEEEYGVNELKTQLTQINGEVQQKLAEYRQIQAQYEALSTDVEGKPITMNSIIGAQAQIQKRLIAEKNSFAADIGLLQAQALALQGSLENAQNMANRAVDLRYEDIQTQIEIKLQQLQLIQPYLTQQQQEKAQLQQNLFTLQRDAISVAIAAEKDQNATLLNFIQQYPDAGITMSDSLTTAQQKIVSNSQTYGKEVAGNNGQATFEDATGKYLVTYDNDGNIVNKVKIGESSSSTVQNTTVSPGQSIVDPNTGEVIYSQPTTDQQNTGTVSTRTPTTEELIQAYKDNNYQPLTEAQLAKLYGTEAVATGTKQTSSVSSSSVTALKNALNQSKYEGAEADGKYADPNLYLDNYNSFIASGGTSEEFFRLFPPKTYINPANTWMPAEIMQFVPGSYASPTSSSSSRSI